jgi:hypothetical protein
MEKKKMREETRQKHYLCFIEFFKILFALFQVVKSVKSDESYSKTALFNSLGLPVVHYEKQASSHLQPLGGAITEQHVF